VNPGSLRRFLESDHAVAERHLELLPRTATAEPSAAAVEATRRRLEAVLDEWAGHLDLGESVDDFIEAIRGR